MYVQNDAVRQDGVHRGFDRRPQALGIQIGDHEAGGAFAGGTVLVEGGEQRRQASAPSIGYRPRLRASAPRP